MKKLILAVALMSASSVSFAADKMDYCQRLSFVAEQIMDVRQMGVPLETVRKIKTDLKEFNYTVDYAYEFPIVKSENEKLLATMKFKRSVYAICMQHKNL